MRGHVRQRGATWTAVYDEPRGEDGKRRLRWKGGFKTKKEAESFLTDVLGRLGRAEYVEPARTTLGEFIDGWLPSIQATIRPTTFSNYKMLCERHIKPRLGNVPLQRLAGAQLDSWYADLLQSGRCDGRGGLSPRSVRLIHVVLHRMLKKAVRQRLVVRNVTEDAEPPAKVKPPMKTWTKEELVKFLEYTREDRLGPAFVLAALTGARRGEVLGASWRSLDLERGEWRITQTLICVDYKPAISEPKTARSRRLLKLDGYTAGVLRERRTRWAEEKLRAGDAWEGEHDLVFCDELGRPVHPQLFTEHFVRQVKEAKLPRIKLHQLRHTHATLLLLNEEHPAVVSERLGHASVAFTLDTYTDSLPALHEAAAEKFASLLGLQAVSKDA